MTIRCEIVSQDRTVFTGDVDIVVLPGAGGEMGVLPKHAPVLTTLKYGLIKVRKGGKEEVFTVAGGVAEVQPDIVTVLADAAENVDEIDEARADAARKRAEEALKKGVPADNDAYLAMEAALRKSNLRLDAVRRYRKNSRSPYSSEQ
ncbi:MAG: F0F1 ATP synthase subunit epsilon [Anaerolineales bacterium]|jgi:F-type H+-transporting ATPase subunit epsilon|uniref:F0F1 ATP synthase subunit epsilon n=1 Tax=Candidatus Villigracilis affinis TaxID=3140682 RepID=UPI001B6C28D3|nr:F0F1 ATP synthase subunit epsilon [Anaerolineales bacterium]MBK9600705.1 F0F1 ATP synthase subunit epsilon [Anaerolineales bacterium]MBL0344600.1 F0F1 ATP synthase subunit epsilon [Anaerolineales bacterium]MBP8048377.1 F0F1 ATP synthase subunit epsilon [Anaerolineales bacterium]